VVGPTSRRTGTDDGSPSRKLPSPTTSSNDRGRRSGGRKRSRIVTTIQDQLESALVMLTNRNIAQLRVRGAGRTDKGVHALGQIVAFDYHEEGSRDDNGDGDGSRESSNDVNGVSQSIFSQASLSDSYGEELWRIRRAINSRLPRDIVVRSVYGLPPPPPGGRPFEARRDVQTKRYTYRLRFRKKRMVAVAGGRMQMIDICSSGPNTLRRAHDPNSIWICPWALDERLVQKACKLLSGSHDFSCFVVKSDRRKRDNNIDLKKFKVTLRDDDDDDNGSEDDESYPAKVKKSGEETSEAIPCSALFTLEAGGFRRQMVRRLVGFAVDIGRGYCCLDDIPKVLTGTDEAASLVNAAPACGLCLSKVEYNRKGLLASVK